MDAVPEEGPEKNVYTGTIIKTLPSPRLGPPRTIVQVSSAPGVRDRFQAGRLAVGSDTYFVHGSKPAENRKYKDVFYPAPAEVEVEGVVPSSVDGTAYTLRDDDDLHRDEIGLHPSLPYDQHSEEIVEAIRPKFAPAFVEVVDANALGLNPNPRIPFRLNEGVRGYWESFNNEKDVEDSPSFWGHTLVIAYQPGVQDDYDPRVDGVDPFYGGTPKKQLLHIVSGEWYASMGYSVVFMEMFRDIRLWGSESVDYSWPGETALSARRDIMRLLYGTIVHEIGHAPGRQHEDDDHIEGDIMREKDPGGMAFPPSLNDNFNPLSIMRFRTSVRWGL